MFLPEEFHGPTGLQNVRDDWATNPFPLFWIRRLFCFVWSCFLPHAHTLLVLKAELNRESHSYSPSKSLLELWFSAFSHLEHDAFSLWVSMNCSMWMYRFKVFQTFSHPAHRRWPTCTRHLCATLCLPPSGLLTLGFLLFGSSSEHTALLLALPLTDFTTEFTLCSNSKMSLCPTKLIKLATSIESCVIFFFFQLTEVTFHLG